MLEAPEDIGDRIRAELADLIDLQLSPLGLAAMDALAPSSGQSVLDVGCGAGQTLVQLAERVGPSGVVTGVDIGARCLAVARARTRHFAAVSLKQANAAQLDLPDGCLDAVYSRFGLMFFDDAVEAFRDLRRMLRPGGRIGFVCWRAIRENELDFWPVGAAGLDQPRNMPHVSFEQPAVIEALLTRAGFEAIDIAPFDADVSCGDVETTLMVLTGVGALGKLLRDAPHLRAAAESKLRAALVDRATGGRVSLNAATWIVTASR